MSAVIQPKRAQTRPRFSRAASAATMIKGFGHDTQIPFALTMGQFSLLDLIEATLDITGPADVAIATWSVAFYDMDAARHFRDLGRMRSCRFIMDSSDKRGQATGADVAAVFGHDAIRTTRTHAKFVVVTNEEWAVVITSSMNLNLNPRSEQFAMIDDRVTADFVLTIVDELFAELPAGATYDRTTPTLDGVPSLAPELGFRATPIGDIRASKSRVRTGNAAR